MATKLVALLAEGVDRNRLMHRGPVLVPVALLAEGVDRNRYSTTGNSVLLVALLAEGVDRNYLYSVCVCPYRGRPPRGGRG